ncbi:MAG: transposase [Clostridiales bacterium]|nr:transposase [Clostridiales bacterium]
MNNRAIFPAKYNRATSYGAAAYVINIKFDKKTGEVLEGEKIPVFNFAKLAEDEQYDGYYSIVTSELEMSEGEIIDTYRGLWEIEETFKITKSDLKARPVYVRNEDHIDAHFLTCFIALAIIRLIQKKMNRKYTTAAIIDCLKKISCSNEYENLYLFDYRSEISDAIGEMLGVDFTYKRLRLGDIKKILGDTKK